MRRVNISTLKAHLAEHLRAARNGETIVVCDRDQPVAAIVPMPDAKGLQIRPPVANANLRAFKRVPLTPGPDSLQMLREDRDRR